MSDKPSEIKIKRESIGEYSATPDKLFDSPPNCGLIKDWWLDLNTEWFHKKFPEHLAKEPYNHEIIRVLEAKAVLARIKELEAENETLNNAVFMYKSLADKTNAEKDRLQSQLELCKYQRDHWIRDAMSGLLSVDHIIREENSGLEAIK
jgi:hypothetical protein